MKGLSSKEMLEKANSEVEGISVHDVNKLILDKKYQVIDIRDRDELMAFGTIPGAKHASRGKIEFFADPEHEYHKDFFKKEDNIILYCQTAGRSALAAYTLKIMGYENVFHMKGGFREWMKEIGKIEDFDDES